MSFEIIKQNYDHGLWPERTVKLAVTKGVITKEQYEEITGNTWED